eukprot:5357944-Amphidinium_carterae.1
MSFSVVSCPVSMQLIVQVIEVPEHKDDVAYMEAVPARSLEDKLFMGTSFASFHSFSPFDCTATLLLLSLHNDRFY